MASLWSSQAVQGATRDDADVADTGLADVGLPNPDGEAASSSAGRPQLQRNQPAPPPPHQPPPPPSPQQIGNPADSLSLMQLKRIVSEFPRTEPTAYAFTYADAAPFEEEIDEWFSYNDAEFARLRRARNTFETKWQEFDEKPWSAADFELRKKFLEREIIGLHVGDMQNRCFSLQNILHIVLGVWDESAGGLDASQANDGEVGQQKSRSTATKSHLDSMINGVLLLTECGGISQVYEVMRTALGRLWYAQSYFQLNGADHTRHDGYREATYTEQDISLMQDELDNVTTIIYILIESARYYPEVLSSTREGLCMYISLILPPSLSEVIVYGCRSL